MPATFNNPFDALFALQRALEASLASDWIGRGTASSGSYPPINVFQREDDLVALVELPGLAKDDLRIEAQESTIRISGKKTINFATNASVHRRERVSGVFDRTLSVPIRINADAVRAEYRDGMLALFIPRAESDKPRRINIG